MLDAGGSFLKFLEDLGFETFGVEISTDACSFAKKRYGLNVFNGTIEEANFKSNSFDAVTCFDVLEHVEHPFSTLKEIHRVLKDNGILLLVVPNFNRVFFSSDWRKEDIFAKEHLFYFTPKTMTEMLKQTGFKIMQMRTGLITWLLPKIFRKFGTEKRHQMKAAGDSLMRKLSRHAIEIARKIDRTEYGNSIEVVAKKQTPHQSSSRNS